MNLFNELLMHVHELYMNMHERSSSDELHFSGDKGYRTYAYPINTKA